LNSDTCRSGRILGHQKQANKGKKILHRQFWRGVGEKKKKKKKKIDQVYLPAEETDQRKFDQGLIDAEGGQREKKQTGTS